jgi:hypothetical protein
VRSPQSTEPLAVALRRAYGAALYLDSTHPGVAEQVGEAVDAASYDESWTAMRWMIFGALVRRACAGLPAGFGNSHEDHAIRTVRLELAQAMRDAYDEIPIGAHGSAN